MMNKRNNDIFYVCSLIEFIARQTKNRRSLIVKKIGIDGINKLLCDAEVNHCLSFEQVGSEVIGYYKIPNGDFDTISGCKYSVPSYQDIGKLYSIIITDLSEDSNDDVAIYKIMSSFLSDEISDFSTDLYYQNPSYLEASYKAGYLLPD